MAERRVIAEEGKPCRGWGTMAEASSATTGVDVAALVRQWWLSLLMC